MHKLIKVTHSKHTLVITLNRPEKRNAFTPNMIAEIGYALKQVETDKTIWAVVFKAEGKVFSAGMDLKIFKNPELETPDPDFEPTNISLGELVASVQVPTIAVVNAPVYAGGFLIVAECNFILASANATFTLPEVRRGIFPFQVMKSLSKSFTQRKLVEWCTLGKTYTSAEALTDGLITRLVPENELADAEADLLHSLFLGSPFAIAKGLAALEKLPVVPEEEAYAFLKDSLSVIRESNDAIEGIQSFVEKRQPRWTNS